MKHPYYSDGTGRPVLIGDRVAKGTKRGHVTGIRNGGHTRIQVTWDGGGWTDECRLSITYAPEPPTVENTLRLSADIHQRIMTGDDTDADRLALADAYRQGYGTEPTTTDDDLFATFAGAGR